MSAESASDAPVEVVAGRYELSRRLGRGGMGEVYSARDRSTGKLVALKRLLPSAYSKRTVVVHFMREYHALSELRHPRIIEVYEYGVDRDVPFYTMELLDGADLRDLSPLPYREACLYLRDVASSLALLHARRLLHRDVSPRNVRRTSDGRCKLLDFGAMIAFGLPPNVTGTVPNISPEALQGASLDQRSDLYSLGALAYYVLTGRYGHDVTQLGDLPAAWLKPLKRPKKYADIPDELDDLVMSLMSLDPMKRPKSAAEVIDWLSAIGQLAPDETLGVARSFMTSTLLCGRERESEELTRHIQRAAEGRGGALMFVGAVGAGKSRMISESVLLAQTCGLATVHIVTRKQAGASYALARELVATVQQVMPVESEAAGARRVLWPRAASGSNVEAAWPAAPDPAEQRARLQQGLLEVFSQVARARPLLVAVDDIDRADEFSSALIAGLAHQAIKLPLLVVCSRTLQPEVDERGSDAFRMLAAQIALHDLARDESDDLVRSMFGTVPNIELLCEWLYRVARGNPKLTLELAGHLFERGIVRYVEGTWVLPSDPINLEVPSDLTAALALRLQSRSASALALAEALSVRRGGATVELCLAVVGGAPEAIFSAIDELVRAGVLESSGREYVFAQDTLKHTIASRLATARSRELHRRWADVLLTEAAQDPELKLEAGWHLVHTDDELRGADMLAEVAPPLIDQGMAMAAAIQALEKAVEVYERLERPLELRLRLRAALVLAGYLFDYRVALRYGDETVTLLHEASGLATAQRLMRYCGAQLAFWLGMVYATVRRPWLPRARRGPPLYKAMRYFVQSAMGMIGVRATGVDAKGVWALFAKVAPLSGAPGWSSGRAVYLFSRALALQMLGRESELRHATQEALHALRRGQHGDLSEAERRHLLVGLLLTDGVNESFREASEALARADLLDGLGTRLAEGGALRIRMNYYARRGDSDRAEYHRHLIDLHAIQGGTLWQGEWFSVPLEGMAGATWTDLVTLRRSLDRLGRLAQEVPSLADLRDSVRISYHFRRGEYARASELGEAYVRAHPPRTLVGWGAVYGVIALSWIEIGQAARALALCERALSQVSEDDLSYFVMYGPLEVAHATALAVQGELARAKEIMHVRIERLRAHGEHASLVNLYQYQARMAQLVGDEALLAEALRAMREAALASGLPAVILLADRVADLRTKRSSPLPPAMLTPLPEAEQRTAQQRATSRSGRPRPAEGQEETAVTVFLQGRHSGRRRSGAALWFLARYLASEEVYLYRVAADGTLQLMAAVPELAEEPALAKLVAATLQERVDDTTVSRVALADDKSYRVLPLSAAGKSGQPLGVVVIRDGTEILRDVSPNILDDIARVLAQDLEAESNPTSEGPS